MVDGDRGSSARSHVTRIPGVTLDEAGFIHTQYGTCHPVTGEGLPIDAPEALMREILVALIDDGMSSGPAQEFGFVAFIEREFGKKDY